MQTIGTGEGTPHWLEKVIRLAIPAALIYGGIKLFNAFAPTLIEFFSNFWTVVAIGAPAVFLALYVVQNPTFLWMGYKTLCRKITSFFIKMDPLSFMDRYVDLLKEKRKGLKESKGALNAKKIELEREIENLKSQINDFLKIAKAAKATGDMNTAGQKSSLAGLKQQSLQLYLPILDKMKANLAFLEKLDENWGMSIEKLSMTVDTKRKEFQMLKDTAKALGAAKEFASGDTEANRIYQESLLALEENVTKKIAFIQEFETDSKGVMKSIDIEKQMMNDEGLELLSKYEEQGNRLFLSEDYSKYEMKIDEGTDLFAKANTSKKVVPPTTVGGSEFSSFLKK